MDRPDPADRARALWSGGRYAAVAGHLRPAAVATVAACDLPPGAAVLDVAAGTGNAALEAAERGARVTASDLTPAMVAAGAERTRAAGHDVRWIEADAQDLPFPDDAYDAAVSVFGAIFAPDPGRAASELARVVRPGGVVALAAWAPEGFSAALDQVVRARVPVLPPGPDPHEWGRPVIARARLAPVCREVRTEARTLPWRFPGVPEFVRFLEEDVPPAAALRMALGEDAPAFRADLVAMIERLTTAPPAVVIDAPWLLVVARV